METTTTTSSGSSDPFESISDFFESGAWDVTLLLVRVFAVALWAALVYWTFQDARRRITSPGFIALSVALSLFIPYLGSIIYLIIRPPEYLDEARERELELLALEQRLGELGDAEGQEIVGKILAREGIASGADAGAMQRALRQAGVALQDDVRDLDARLSELELRMRMGRERPQGGSALLPPSGDSNGAPENDPAGLEAGDTSRRPSRMRRFRSNQDSYD